MIASARQGLRRRPGGDDRVRGHLSALRRVPTPHRTTRPATSSARRPTSTAFPCSTPTGSSAPAPASAGQTPRATRRSTGSATPASSPIPTPATWSPPTTTRSIRSRGSTSRAGPRCSRSRRRCTASSHSSWSRRGLRILATSARRTATSEGWRLRDRRAGLRRQAAGRRQEGALAVRPRLDDRAHLHQGRRPTPEASTASRTPTGSCRSRSTATSYTPKNNEPATRRSIRRRSPASAPGDDPLAFYTALGKP